MNAVPQLDILPERTGGAAENMATDFLLLQKYPSAQNCRFRHYEWRGPAFTFGYSQKVAGVRAALPAGEHFDLCRRPTGGGIVDHRADWTYTLVIPRGHPLEEMRAGQSYRLLHLAIERALVAQGVPARMQQSVDVESAEGRPANACFERAELYDVVHDESGAKIAGAAQKRNKNGLLFQGTILKPSAAKALEGTPAAAGPMAGRAAAPGVDWEKFGEDFVAELGPLLETTPAPAPWPELDEEELSALTEHYASAEWMEFR